jgi:hypothetical protein
MCLQCINSWQLFSYLHSMHKVGRHTRREQRLFRWMCEFKS